MDDWNCGECDACGAFGPLVAKKALHLPEGRFCPNCTDDAPLWSEVVQEMHDALVAAERERDSLRALLVEAGERIVEAYSDHMSEQWKGRALRLVDRIDAATREPSSESAGGER